MNEECAGRGHMDMARMLSLKDGTKFEHEIDRVQAMIADRCLIPCPVHPDMYVISLKWAREHFGAPSVPDESLLEAECFTRQLQG